MKNLVVHVCLAALLAGHALAQDVQPDTSYTEYSDPPLTLPLGIGLRVPSYDRVNGLALPWGPKLVLGNDRFELDALVTYRSHLGQWDPSLEATLRPGYGHELELVVGRGTFTSDAWIRPGLVNSGASLFFGSDARNYYRADRAQARYTRELTMGRTDDLKMRRPNPQVFDGKINSALAGVGLELFRGEVEGKLRAQVEKAFKSPWVTCAVVCTTTDEGFTQSTVHATVDFPTFGTQTFTFRAHAVFGGDFVPPQRYAYLGGASSLATVDLLALGGDRLFFAEADYRIPLERIVLRPVGSPFIALHYATGSAGVGELPALIQNLGVGAGISMIRVDYTIDPASNRSPFSRRSAFSVGLSLTL
jgi:hypothetical protein